MAKDTGFQDARKEASFGQDAYQWFIERHRDHFLVALQELCDWHSYADLLVQLYLGRAQRGRPPYDPELLFKMLLISHLYDLSDRDTERLASENVPVKWFLGLALDEAPPDHAILGALKQRMMRQGSWETVREMLHDLSEQARAQGLEAGSIRTLDSVPTGANVSNTVDREPPPGSR